MTEKIEITGTDPKKIKLADQSKRRIDPAKLASELGAIPSGQHVSDNSIDIIGLAELGTQLLHRLRSSGGRPALADASINCRVPLSADDLQKLEEMLSHIGSSTGTKPSVGQLVSVIVRLYLSTLENVHERQNPLLDATDVAQQFHGHNSERIKKPHAEKSSWLDAKNGKRMQYRQAQAVIQGGGTTWGKNVV
jgi:hypothetical protein